MAEQPYKHGEMNIEDQQKTFDGFVRWAVRIGAVCIAVILFLAIYAQ